VGLHVSFTAHRATVRYETTETRRRTINKKAERDRAPSVPLSVIVCCYFKGGKEMEKEESGLPPFRAPQLHVYWRKEGDTRRTSKALLTSSDAREHQLSLSAARLLVSLQTRKQGAGQGMTTYSFGKSSSSSLPTFSLLFLRRRPSTSCVHGFPFETTFGFLCPFSRCRLCFLGFLAHFMCITLVAVKFD
jgi:hypothetical protein